MTLLTKSSLYGLCAAMELAATRGDRPLTALHVATRYCVPAAVLAKVFQQLVRTGIAVGTRGSGGGYRLARDASRVTMLDVIETFQPHERAGCPSGRQLDAAPAARARVRRLESVFDEIDDTVRATYASITLSTLVASPSVRRPSLGDLG